MRHKTRLTPRFLMALLSNVTTSIPSTPLALKRFVHVIRKPCRQTESNFLTLEHLKTKNEKISHMKVDNIANFISNKDAYHPG